MRETKEQNKEKEEGKEEEIAVVKVNGVVAVEGQCGCSVLTFIYTRQVGAAIPATLSDAVFTSTHQSKSSNLGCHGIWLHSKRRATVNLLYKHACRHTHTWK